MSTTNDSEKSVHGSDREIIIAREFDAPPELIWEALTDASKIGNWWGPEGFATTTEVMDLRVGGEWKHVMHGPDGTNYPNESVFTEVNKPTRLSYKHAGSKVGVAQIHFEMHWTLEKIVDSRTKLTIHQVFQRPEDREKVVVEYGAIEGGKQTLARLAKLIEGQKQLR